ncbi:NADH-quinone oxidoreductase subunit K, partial [Micromonospora yasonensis]|uniref:NADH-quinone oxidoreductase subunit NuoK n=1 Tax=Micromonospora yasonensis TaxID=1128667 RepID=UPI00222E487E
LVTADTTVRARLPHSGQVFALFVIVLAAAEIGVGLAIVLQLYRLRASVTVDDVPLTEPPAPLAAVPAGGDATTTAGGDVPPAGRRAGGPEGEK